MSRFTAVVGALVTIGVAGTLAGAAPAAAALKNDISASESAQAVAGWEFAGWYSSLEQCKGGGDIYLNHGYRDYLCELDTLRGWALMILS